MNSPLLAAQERARRAIDFGHSFLVCQVASRYLIAAENAPSRGIEKDQTTELAASRHVRKDRAGLICSNKLSHLDLKNSARKLPLLLRERE